MSSNEPRKQFQQECIANGIWKSCLNCNEWGNNAPEHKNKPHIGCQRANGVTPPPEIVVHGCDSWQHVIPF